MGDDRDAGAAGIILSFLVGGLTGAALAILFAPRSGRETRDLLGERLKEGADRGREVRDKVTSRSRELLDEAGEYVDHQKETVERHKDRLTAAVEAGRQAYREERAKGET